jgi:hypothetical protein
MTEAEWLTCDNPHTLLGHCRGGLSERRQRLLAAAFCRDIRGLFVDGNCLRAVEIIEAYADGEASAGDLRLAANGATADWDEFGITKKYNEGQRYAIAAVAHAAGEVDPVVWALRSACSAVGSWAAFAATIRDVVRNPFRPVAFDPAWRTDTVVSLAREVYASRDFAAMPILADALQDAGCEAADLLPHCRDESRVHVRGCWVVDRVLGKV